jgi:3-oxoadipate enol-lactonase
MDDRRLGAARTRDGVVLRYTIQGEAATHRVVLVHSLAMAGDVWEDVALKLAADAAVLTYDCRGHGSSTKSPGPYRLETFADDLADLLDLLGWASIDLAGASMGGNVALQFAARYPSRVRTLGLVDTTAWYGPEAAEKWDQRARTAETKGLASMIDFQESRWFSDAFRQENDARVQRCRALFLANDVAAFAATCRMLGAFDLRSALPSLTMPSAVVVGEHDYATPPAMAEVLHRGLSDSTLQVIPGVRHLTFVERPEVVSAALEDLHRRGSGDRPRPDAREKA